MNLLLFADCIVLINSLWLFATTWSVHGLLKNTIVGCHPLLQGIFLTQGSNPDLLHCRQILCHLSYKGSHWFYILLSKESWLCIVDPYSNKSMNSSEKCHKFGAICLQLETDHISFELILICVAWAVKWFVKMDLILARNNN